MRVADYIAEKCAEAGLKDVFLVTGGGAMHLNDAFSRNQQLRCTCFHHEQAAAIAAEGYCRTIGRMAVLNVTTGPGGINALNGVYGAYVDSIAMIIISGQVKRETYGGNVSIPLRQLGDQEVNIVSMARPIVKFATVLQDKLKVREVVEKALFLASHGRPGPVWIDVPIDVQGELVDSASLCRWDSDASGLASDADVCPNTRVELETLVVDRLDAPIAEICRQIKQSKRPAILVGTGVRISRMHDQLLDLIDRLKIPVVTGWNAHDLVSNDNPCYAGRPGTVGDRGGNFTVQNADFLMILGCRLNIRQISYNWKRFAPRAWKVMVDVDRAELDKPTISIDLKVHARLQDFIPRMSSAVDKHEASPAHHRYLSWCRARVDKYPVVLPQYGEKSEPLNPYVFIDALFDGLTGDETIVAGNGSACVVTFQAAKLKQGQRLFTNSGAASMGYDLPAAIGASIAIGRGKVICLAGDGSLMMNLQELQTLVGYRLPVKVVILNNYGYQSIRQTQQAYFPDNIFGIDPINGVSFPDFVALGGALGIASARVRNLRDWRSEDVQRLMNSADPAVIEVVLDPTQGFSPKLASRKLPDGQMISPSLEDMAPFMSREELLSNTIETD